MSKLVSNGCLKISNEEDRRTVATILFKNGYTVHPVRCKKNGKTYEYFVKYELIGNGSGYDISEKEAGYEES